MTTEPAIQRVSTERRVAGVCAAAATRWNVDPVILRVAAVALAVSGGVGLVLYALAWAWWPCDGRPALADRIAPRLRETSPALRIALLLILVIPTTTAISTIIPMGIFPALVIVATWWWCTRRGRGRRWSHRDFAGHTGPVEHRAAAHPVDRFPEPDGLASDFAPSPHAVPDPTAPDDTAAASGPDAGSAPRRPRARRVWVTVTTVLMIGMAVFLPLQHYMGLHASIGVPAVLVAAGIAGLLARSPRGSRSPHSDRSDHHS